MSGVAAQWNLDTTSISALSVGRGLLVASTSDNVQPLALLACESFGSTLAICPETIAKVERVIVPSPPPAVLQFIQAQVGFFKDDSASYFGRSAAGVRFLGLAAALVTIVPSETGTNALDLILRKNKTDLTLLPTLRQLHALLDAISARCHRGDFASSLVGWHMMLRPLICDLQPRMRVGNSNHYDLIVMDHLSNSPTADMLEQLIDVFRQVARIGESSVLGATIKISTSLVWVVAFSRWCLGYTPRVFWGEHSRKNILPDDPQSRITIVACNGARLKKEIEVAIHDALGTRLSRLIEPDLSGGMLGSQESTWDGMISVQEYGAWRLHQLEIEHQLSEFDDYMAHAVPLVEQLFQADTLDPRKVPPRMKARRCNPFHDLKCLDKAYRILFQRAPPEWKLSDRKGKVGAKEMLPSLGGLQSFYANASDKWEEAIESLPHLVLDLVVISMLVDPETARCSSGDKFSDDFDSKDSKVENLERCCRTLLSGAATDESRPESWPIMDILDWAALLFGWDSYSSDYVLSSDRGQTMYIEAYESLTLRAKGYLRLFLLPGVIRYKNETYSVLREAQSRQHSPVSWQIATRMNLSDEMVQYDRFPGCSVQWVVTASGFSSLEALPHMLSDEGEIGARASPSKAMRSMASAAIAVTCEHAKRATGPADTGSATRETVHMASIGMHRTEVPFGAVGVVTTSGSHDRRFLAAGCHWNEEFSSSRLNMVIRRDACFHCCVQLCILNDIRILIL